MHSAPSVMPCSTPRPNGGPVKLDRDAKSVLISFSRPRPGANHAVWRVAVFRRPADPCMRRQRRRRRLVPGAGRGNRGRVGDEHLGDDQTTMWQARVSVRAGWPSDIASRSLPISHRCRHSMPVSSRCAGLLALLLPARLRPADSRVAPRPSLSRRGSGSLIPGSLPTRRPSSASSRRWPAQPREGLDHRRVLRVTDGEPPRPAVRGLGVAQAAARFDQGIEIVQPFLRIGGRPEGPRLPESPTRHHRPPPPPSPRRTARLCPLRIPGSGEAGAAVL